MSLFGVYKSPPSPTFSPPLADVYQPINVYPSLVGDISVIADISDHCALRVVDPPLSANETAVDDCGYMPLTPSIDVALRPSALPVFT